MYLCETCYQCQNSYNSIKEQLGGTYWGSRHVKKSEFSVLKISDEEEELLGKAPANVITKHSKILCPIVKLTAHTRISRVNWISFLYQKQSDGEDQLQLTYLTTSQADTHTLAQAADAGDVSRCSVLSYWFLHYAVAIPPAVMW